MFIYKIYFRVSPEGVDLFLDCVCGEECSRGYSLLKPMGKYILFGKYIFFQFLFLCFLFIKLILKKNN